MAGNLLIRLAGGLSPLLIEGIKRNDEGFFFLQNCISYKIVGFYI